MAQHTTIELIDDLDPDYKADETVTFAIDGITYEIDLHAEHAEHLRAALALFTSHGRRIRRAGSSIRRTTRPTPAAPNADPKAVREWAKEHGIAVSGRGRIPFALVAQFSEATG